MKKKRIKIIIILISVFLISISIYLLRLQNQSFYNSDYICEYDETKAYPLSLELYSDHYYIFNVDTGIDYYAYKEDEIIYPASITKLMTLDTILNLNVPLDDEIVVSYDDFDLMYARNASVAGLTVGSSYTMEDLLYAMVLPSGADACEALERYFLERDIDLVAKMNERAKELKMDNSHFINTTGLYEDEHVTTLKDIKKLVIDLYADEVAYDILSTFEYVTGDEKYYSSLYNLGMDDYETVEILGGKTGYTYESKQNIMVLYRHGAYTFCMLLAEADGEEGGQYHVADVYTILDYLYAF